MQDLALGHFSLELGELFFEGIVGSIWIEELEE